LKKVDEVIYLNKQCFQDLIRIRYGWPLLRTSSSCECGSPLSLDHALSCKKVEFASMRHNTIRDFTARLLSKICRDVKIEPLLQILEGTEDLQRWTDRSDEARLDIAARGSFWVTGQKAFFDVKVFNPLAKRYVSLDPQRCYEINEKEKKKCYNARVLEIEHASFTPLVFSATGGASCECKQKIPPSNGRNAFQKEEKQLFGHHLADNTNN